MAVYRIKIPETWITTIDLELTKEEEKLPVSHKVQYIKELALRALDDGKDVSFDLVETSEQEKWTIERIK